jgi:predicted ATPase
VVDLLERMLGLGRQSTLAQVTAAVETLLSRYRFELDWAVPLFAALLSIRSTSGHFPPHQKKEETFRVLIDLFLAMAEAQPVLLAVEDVHWADPATLELLSALMKEAAGTRLYVVLTARPELTPPWPQAQVLQVHLARLERP